MSSHLKPGVYVLATKWHDGDPLDQWCVGFYHHFDGNRHYVVDENGKQFRENGFRRVEQISAQRGQFIIEHKEEILLSMRRLWWWKRVAMARYDETSEA